MTNYIHCEVKPKFDFNTFCVIKYNLKMTQAGILCIFHFSKDKTLVEKASQLPLSVWAFPMAAVD